MLSVCGLSAVSLPSDVSSALIRLMLPLLLCEISACMVELCATAVLPL